MSKDITILQKEKTLNNLIILYSQQKQYIPCIVFLYITT